MSDFLSSDDELRDSAPQQDTVVKQQEMVSSAINTIDKAGIVSEDVKKVLASTPVPTSVSTTSSAEKFADDLVSELSTFMFKQLDLDNEDGGHITKLPFGIDLLDMIAGGGLGGGKVTVIAGNPGTFKSALLAQLIAHNQKIWKGLLTSLFHDSESAMTSDRLSNLGVRFPRIEPYSDITVESVFKSIIALGAFKEAKKILDKPSIIGWDSLANTSTDKERTTENINETVGLKARLLAGLFPRFVPKLAQMNISLVIINQLRDKMQMGPYSAPADLANMGDKDMPGGQALKYNAFHLLMLRNIGELKQDQYGFGGIKLKAHFVKNKFFRPNIPIEMIVDFNTGISNMWTNYNFLSDQGALQTGAWNMLLIDPGKKFRTKDFPELYNSDQDFRGKFDAEVKKHLNIFSSKFTLSLNK